MRIPADYGGLLRIIGWFTFGFAALALLVIILNAATGGSPSLTSLIVPAVIAGFGGLFRFAANVVERGDGPEMPIVGSWVFKGFGIAVMVMGAVSMFEDPAAIFAIVFGALFFGAGHLVKTLFATPEGKKQVFIPDVSHLSRDEAGLVKQHSSGSIIYVDEDADEGEVDDAVRDWRREQLASRADWANKRIEGETSRNAPWRKYGPVLTGLVSVPLLIFAYFDGDPIIWAVGSIFGIVTIGGTYELIRDRRRLEAFGKSYLELEMSPGVIGETLSGTVETGIPIGKRPASAFRLTLDCDLRWEETSGSGEDRETYRRSRRLWRDKKTARIAFEPGMNGVVVPFSFKLPSDAKPTSLGSINDGIRWSLKVSAEMKGIDFNERFIIPIITNDMS